MDFYKTLLCLTGLFGVVSCCDTALINQCTEGFADDAGVSKDKLEQGFLPVITRETLKRTCKAYDNFETCVKSYRGYCPTSTRVQLEGIEDLYEYICGEGFEKHLKHEPCLNGQGVEVNVLQCSQKVSRQFDTYFLNKNDVCNIFKDSIDCIEDAVGKACGSEAAEHQVEIEKRFLQPLASEIDCNLDGGINLGLIIGVIIVVVIIIIVSVAICLCCARKKNSRRYAEQNQQQQMNVVTQPGATAPSYPVTVVSPPAYNVYEDPNAIHDTKPPVYDNLYAHPSEAGGIDNRTYTGLPGKQ